MIRTMFSPIIKSTIVFTISGSVQPSCCLLVPAATWLNTTRYCKYSQVLLMIGEKIVQNMLELTWNNKLIYRVSIKSFPDYKHLLQENYVEYKHIFLM
jgi:DNA polymerase III sliding clamp (beta) subunit (PCNA family)